MDPLSAVGLASSIITFIDFGLKIIVNGVCIYKSAEGISTDHKLLQESLDRLDALYKELSDPLAIPSAAALNGSELELTKIAAECADTAKQLRAALQELVAEPHSVRSSVAKAVQAIFDKKVKKCQKRLSQLNDEFQRYMTAVLLDRQSSIFQLLKTLSVAHKQLCLDGQSEVNKMGTDLFNLIENGQKSVGERLVNLADVCQAIQRILADSQRLNMYHTQLERLYFAGMDSRKANVHVAHPGTFSWIFNRRHAGIDVSFAKWLSSGFRSFLIIGKAGSGKSALMKFVADHEQTMDLLRAWAGSHQLVTGSFYFWNAGNKMGQSLEGLLRSIIFDILKQCPELVSRIPHCQEWNMNWKFNKLNLQESHWSQRDLMQILENFVLGISTSRRFCFFVDGLDESSAGDPETAEVFSRIVSWPNFKLCLASRPRPTFEAFFGGERVSTLVLHEYTREDIRKYAADLLNFTKTEDKNIAAGNIDDESAMRLVSARAGEEFHSSTHIAPHGLDGFKHEEISHLLDTIEADARGVFLWVFLVVKRLRKCLYTDDTFKEIMDLCKTFPQDLTGYFNQILDSIEADYWQSSSEILLMCIARCIGSIPLLAFQSITPLPEILTLTSFEQWKKRATRRIESRCPDLLIFNFQEHPFHERHQMGPSVEFAHRTMLEFFQQPETINKIWSRVDSAYDPNLAICESLTRRLPDLAKLHNGLPSSLPDRIWFAAIDSSRTPRNIVYQTIDKAHRLLEAARGVVEHARWSSVKAVPLYYHTSDAEAYLLHIFRTDPGFFNRVLIHAWGHQSKPLEIIPAAIVRFSYHSEPLDLLLRHGADPNRLSTESDRTIWSYFLHNDNATARYYRERPRWSEDITSMLCSMINGGADPNATLVYWSIDRKKQEGTIEVVADELLRPEDAAQVKRLAQLKRQEKAREEIAHRANWLGWE